MPSTRLAASVSVRVEVSGNARSATWVRRLKRAMDRNRRLGGSAQASGTRRDDQNPADRPAKRKREGRADPPFACAGIAMRGIPTPPRLTAGLFSTTLLVCSRRPLEKLCEVSNPIVLEQSDTTAIVADPNCIVNLTLTAERMG